MTVHQQEENDDHAEDDEQDMGDGSSDGDGGQSDPPLTQTLGEYSGCTEWAQVLFEVLVQ